MADGDDNLEDLHNILYNDIDEDNAEIEETTFDRSLAAQHDYLGSDWEEVRGRTLYDESCVVSLPIIRERGIVLFPGQTLPLTVFYRATIDMLRKVVEKDKTFGVVCVKGPPTFQMASIGTTAEIFQYIDGNGLEYFKLKAKGRQRFKILDFKHFNPRTMLANVRILPEVDMPKFFIESRLPSLKRYRNSPKIHKRLSLMDDASMYWPNAFFKNYNIDHITNLVVKELVALKVVESKESVPADATHLSYFAIQSLPFEEDKKLFLLGRHTALERLQAILLMLERGNIICCRHCLKTLGRRRDVFSMSVEGPSATYCNPVGRLHDVITLNKATGITLEGQQPSTEFSWFPGYGWTVAHCSACWWHVGWLFTAMSTDLHPYRFWALTKRSVGINAC